MDNLGFRDDPGNSVASDLVNLNSFDSNPYATNFFDPFTAGIGIANPQNTDPTGGNLQHQPHPNHQQLPSFSGLFGGPSDPYNLSPFTPSSPSPQSHFHTQRDNFNQVYPSTPPAYNNHNNYDHAFGGSWNYSIPDFPLTPNLHSGLPNPRVHPSPQAQGCPFAPPQNRPSFNQHPNTPFSATHPPRLTINTAPSQAPYNNYSIPERDPGGDDYYLAALAAGGFSAPSLPPISSPFARTQPQSTNLPKPYETGEDMPGAASRRRASREGVVDLTKEEPDFDAPNYGIDPTTPTLTMPATTRKRSSATAAHSAINAPSRKRRTSISTSSRPIKSRRKEAEVVSSPFDDEEDELAGPKTEDAHEHIDLSNATEVPGELLAPKVDNRIKLGKFQCVICMDDVTALTVTHCGHLFCSECLHSALHIDSMKRTCPVCRTKVDAKDKKGKNVKSFYHLELKVLTATKKGKRPAGPS